MKRFTCFCCDAQPSFPDFGVPSIITRMSSEFWHFMTFLGSGTLQDCVLHALYCNLAGSQSPAHLPAPSEGSLTNRTLFLVPESQSLLQPVHLVHLRSTQSLEHAAMLQVLVSVVASQGLPPYFIACLTSRVRCWTPPPHFALHLLQPLHVPILQSTGHGPRLHFFFAVSGMHLAPLSGCFNTVRVSFCSPPAHFLLQASGVHFATSQSWKNPVCPFTIFLK